MTTQIMGILNLTDDSFFDGGKYTHLDRALSHAEYMISEGAEWIDIGAESTRPGSGGVSVEQELDRIVPVAKSLISEFGDAIKFSCDTSKPEVAKEVLNLGFSMINDVTGFSNPEMVSVLSKDSYCCVMHMQGSPQSMQNSPMYPRGVVAEVQDFLFQQAQILLQNGLKKERIFLDPGIGFGKTLEDNLKILNAIPELKKLGFPLLFGVSRKSFIQKITGRSALNALAGTLAVNMCLMKENVNIIRVHDVSEHVDLRAIYAELGGNK